MSLEPVRRALLEDARADADEVRGVAERDAAATVDAAREQAAEILADARAEGEAEASAVTASELARARRTARERVLAGQRELADRLRRDVRDAVVALRDDPDYPELLAGLRGRALAQLGDDAVVEVDGEVGGLVARLGSHSVDYRLPAVADRILDELGAEVDPRWW